MEVLGIADPAVDGGHATFAELLEQPEGTYSGVGRQIRLVTGERFENRT
jgi:hypothetical protein